jgi:hypothetical protein
LGKGSERKHGGERELSGAEEWIAGWFHGFLFSVLDGSIYDSEVRRTGNGRMTGAGGLERWRGDVEFSGMLRTMQSELAPNPWNIAGESEWLSTT